MLYKNIFISYSEENKIFVNRLTKESKLSDYNFFIYKNIQPGEKWLPTLESELANCDAAFVILSKNWLNSSYCQEEYNILNQRRIEENEFKIFTILIEKLSKKKIPPFLKSLIWIECLTQEEKDWQQFVENVYRALNSKPLIPNNRTGLPLTRLTYTVFGSFLLLIIAISDISWSSLRTSFNWQILESKQFAVQKIDNRLENIILKETFQIPSKKGYMDYVDPDSNRLIAKDEFGTNGKLSYRHFYTKGTHVAFDKFEYKNYVLVKKIRHHLDSQKRLIIIDIYDYENGGPIEKTEYPKGNEKSNDATTRYVMRPESPPPNVTFIPSLICVYR